MQTNYAKYIGSYAMASRTCVIKTFEISLYTKNNICFRTGKSELSLSIYAANKTS